MDTGTAGTAGTGADFLTGTGHFGKFGTTSIPVPDTPESSVHQYRYRTLQVRYINTGTSGTGMDFCTGAGTGIGTTSIPVPDTLVSPVQHQPGTGHSGMFGTTSIRYRHIVTSSPGLWLHASTHAYTHLGPTPLIVFRSTHLGTTVRVCFVRPFFAFTQKSLFIMRPYFAYRAKSLFTPGCVQGAII